jgi:hypothetical protein
MGGSGVSVDERIRKAIGAGNLQGYKALLVEKRALLIGTSAHKSEVSAARSLKDLARFWRFFIAVLVNM